MPRILSFLFSFSVLGAYAQCPYPATVSGTRGYCVDDTLLVHCNHGVTKIVWFKDGIPVNYVNGSLYFNQKFDTLVYAQTGGHLFVDDNLNVYTDNGAGTAIERWAPGAVVPVVLAQGLSGAPSVNASQSAQTSAFFVDGSLNVYAIDYANGRVLKFPPDGTSPTVVAGGGANKFNDPTSLYVDCDGSVYVGDNTFGLSRWVAGQLASKYYFGSIGTAIGRDANENIYVAMGGNNIVKLPPDLSTYVVVAGSATSVDGTSGNYITFPHSMSVDHDGNLLVADNYRVTSWPGGKNSATEIDNPANKRFYAQALFVDCRGSRYYTITYLNGSGYVRNLVVRQTAYTSTDTSFIPQSAGSYYALVTDAKGNTATTNTVTVHTANPVPPSVSITASDSNLSVCEAATFTATAANAPGTPSFQWEESGVPVGTDAPSYTGDVFGNGDLMYCIMTASNGCALVADTSNRIRLSVDPLGHASVAVTASQNPVCAGTPIDFTAVVSNASASPVLDWFVNGVDTHFGGSAFSADTFASGDVVYCEIVSDASCGLGRSNSIPVGIYEPPTVDSGQVFNIHYGTSLQLNPTVSGDVAQYIWSPGADLSSTSIPDPIATPSSTTLYTLTVVSPAGCTDSGHILVDVYTPLSVPGGFTPNNDGINDIFYILGGPYGSTIDEFSVFNQWGQQVFEVHGVEPGNPAYGWNGYFHGVPAPTGTYVYFARMKLPGGQVQAYKGTVELMR